jgi:hypothetical protein
MQNLRIARKGLIIGLADEPASGGLVYTEKCGAFTLWSRLFQRPYVLLVML